MLEITDAEINDAYEQNAPELLFVWCNKLKAERDALRAALINIRDADFDDTGFGDLCRMARDALGEEEA